MYESIKQAILGKVQESEVTSFEDAYNKLYQFISRLSDMDDFTTSLLRSIQNKITNGKSFDEAFASTIDSEYEGIDFTYFAEAFKKYRDDIELAFNNAIANPNPARSWNADINWLVDHAVISVDGTDYTIKQLQRKLNGEGGDY